MRGCAGGAVTWVTGQSASAEAPKRKLRLYSSWWCGAGLRAQARLRSRPEPDRSLVLRGPKVRWDRAICADAIIAEAAEAAALEIVCLHRREHLVHQRGEAFGFLVRQRHEERTDRGQSLLQQLLAERVAAFREVKRDRPPIAPLSTLNEAIGDEPIDQANRAWV